MYDYINEKFSCFLSSISINLGTENYMNPYHKYNIKKQWGLVLNS